MLHHLKCYCLAQNRERAFSNIPESEWNIVLQDSSIPGLGPSDRYLERCYARRPIGALGATWMRREPLRIRTLLSPQTGLVYLFPFRVGFALAEVFVIIGETIHEQPEKADEARAH